MKTTLVTLSLILTLAASANAATFTVDNTVDPGDGVCGAPGCTLREAITAANANPGADIIAFNVPGAGVHTFTPASALPVIADTVTIDGYTQPGASANTLAVGDNAVLQIEINGSVSASAVLILSSPNSMIRGLVINRGTDYGILVSGNGAAGNVVEGNFIGTDADGTCDLGNAASGIWIELGASQNLIGGPLPSARNLLSGNDDSGILLFAFVGPSTTMDNTIQGNYIGTDRNRTAALPNGEHGIFISTNSDDNLVGGLAAGTGNLISGNTGSGILIATGAIDTNPLADPMLELRDGNGASVMANDNWKSTQQAAIEATGLQPSDDLD